MFALQTSRASSATAPMPRTGTTRASSSWAPRRPASGPCRATRATSSSRCCRATRPVASPSPSPWPACVAFHSIVRLARVAAHRTLVSALSPAGPNRRVVGVCIHLVVEPEAGVHPSVALRPARHLLSHQSRTLRLRSQARPPAAAVPHPLRLCSLSKALWLHDHIFLESCAASVLFAVNIKEF